MSDRLIRLIAKAIGAVDGVNAPTYEHLAKAAVAVIEQEFENLRRENDRLRDLMSLQNTEIAKLRAALKPFADKAHPIEPICSDDAIYGFDITVGDLRATAAAIGDKNDG